MQKLDSEGLQLLTAIRASDDDTPRLALADYLDEQEPVRVLCPKCGGSKIEHQGRSGWIDCPRCDKDDEGKPMGTALDTSAADRAAMIRVQCRPHGCTPACSQECGHQPPCTSGVADALLARRPEWLRLPCPDCGASGRVESVTRSSVCDTCGGTGDLFTERNHYGHVPAARTLRWDRGLVVVEAAVAECWTTGLGYRVSPETWQESGGANTVTVPTPWLRAVAANPWVGGVWVGAREPRDVEDNQSMWCRPLRNDTESRPLIDPWSVPAGVFDLMTGQVRQTAESGSLRESKFYPTPDAARLAIARGLVRWASTHSKNERKVTHK